MDETPIRKLAPGITVYSADFSADELSHRIELSEGLAPASPQDQSVVPFLEDAFIPREPWRAPTKEQKNILLSSQPSRDLSLQIGVLKVPDQVLGPFNWSGLAQIKTVEEFRMRSRSPESLLGISRFLDFVRPFHDSRYPLTPYPILMNRPRLPVTTYDSVHRGYIGLHLDSWEGLAIVGRSQAGNRISVNLGCQERYFMFLNIPMHEVVSTLRALNPKFDWDTSEPKEGVKRFLEVSEKVPVVKIRLLPGEAYIAPTENMIHEGQPSQTNWADIQLTVRGYFPSRPR